MDGIEIVAARVDACRQELDRPAIVGIAGAVAAGKSTLAAEMSARLEAGGLGVEVIATDGFLHPNHWLAERGLLAHKGFPESYDIAALRDVLDALRADKTGVRVPVYSHETYDVVQGEGRLVPSTDVIVLEGVNALGAARDRIDLAVYVDADADDLERWYVTRFFELVAEARDDPSSFYGSMTDLPPTEVDRLARSTWRSVNLPNLRDHIEPTRATADIVIVKGPDHRITEVRED